MILAYLLMHVLMFWCSHVCQVRRKVVDLAKLNSRLIALETKNIDLKEKYVMLQTEASGSTDIYIYIITDDDNNPSDNPDGPDNRLW